MIIFFGFAIFQKKKRNLWSIFWPLEFKHGLILPHDLNMYMSFGPIIDEIVAKKKVQKENENTFDLKDSLWINFHCCYS